MQQVFDLIILRLLRPYIGKRSQYMSIVKKLSWFLITVEIEGGINTS